MQTLTKQADKLIQQLKSCNARISSAESCTGGMFSSAITSIPGSSKVFEQSFITYSYQSKINILNVTLENLSEFGAVSEVIAKEMAVGCINLMSENDINVAVSITGIASPSILSSSINSKQINNASKNEKPAGLVFICAILEKNNNEKLRTIVSKKLQLSGSRHEIRTQSTLEALKMAINLIS